jgi:gas vesicle protein
MNDNSGQTFLSFLIGVILGGLVGAAVALLYAPQSGEETRAAIRDKSIELKEQAAEQATYLKEQAQQRIDALQQQVTDLQEKMQKQAPPPAAPPVAE